MTNRDLYDYALIEMNKVEAPSLLLEDYNYFMNKAVQQYINKVYNRYDINQQSTDDIRVLKSTATVELKHSDWNDSKGRKRTSVLNKTKLNYSGILPKDYIHILNCIVEFRVKKNFKCYHEGDYIEFAAKRLTADMASGILHNAYMKPTYKRPYFYINNINDGFSAEIDPEDTKVVPHAYSYTDSSIDGPVSTVAGEKGGAIAESVDRDSQNKPGNRVANISNVRMEIRFGEDDSVFEPVTAYVDYIKAPRFIQLTYADITSTEDTTEPLEFPDYVCYEIVNEFVKLLMENASDPRLQTNYAINQTVGNPIANDQSQQGDKS